jgi:ankyrin repeat protein
MTVTDPGRAFLLLLAAVSIAAAADADRRVADAAARQDKSSVRALIRQGANPNTPQGDGTTALHWAVHWDDQELADLLIRSGAALNASNDLGVTPLWLACENGSPTMIERLLKAGANANLTLSSGETPLMMAARSGNVRGVKLLLSRGAQANAIDQAQGQTALMWATAERHSDVVQALLEAGADVHARSRTWREVVLPAGGAGTSRRNLAERTEGGYTALLFAAQQGDIEIAKLLLAAGANVNDAAPAGTSALVVAAHSGHGPLAAYLLERGADPNAAEAGYTALHVAILHKDLQLVEALLSHGANPNTPIVKATPSRRASRDYALSLQMVGGTPLWLGAYFKEPDIMRALVAKGADPKSKTPNGRTVLMAALDGRRVTEDEPAGPSEAGGSMMEAAKLALSLGIDVNAADADGNTVLHMAASRGFDAIIQLLATGGAQLEVKNKKGQTPLAVASGRGAAGAATADLLRKVGAKD